MKDILEEIIARKREEVAALKASGEPARLIKCCDLAAHNPSLKTSLATSPTGIIAEFKRRSPSKGWIKEEGDAGLIPAGYEQAGASALSILTDGTFFGGSTADVTTARPMVSLPILRKDFIIDECQLLQTKAIGANAVLLIAACLSPKEASTLARQAHALNLEVLLEIHSECELDYIGPDIDLVGVNNRHLGTFHTDVSTSFHLAELLPREMVKVSESGLSSPETLRDLRQAGYRGFLIGETFMKTPDPGQTLKTWINKLL